MSYQNIIASARKRLTLEVASADTTPEAIKEAINVFMDAAQTATQDNLISCINLMSENANENPRNVLELCLDEDTNEVDLNRLRDWMQENIKSAGSLPIVGSYTPTEQEANDALDSIEDKGLIYDFANYVYANSDTEDNADFADDNGSIDIQRIISYVEDNLESPDVRRAICLYDEATACFNHEVGVALAGLVYKQNYTSILRAFEHASTELEMPKTIHRGAPISGGKLAGVLEVANVMLDEVGDEEVLAEVLLERLPAKLAIETAAKPKKKRKKKKGSFVKMADKARKDKERKRKEKEEEPTEVDLKEASDNLIKETEGLVDEDKRKDFESRVKNFFGLKEEAFVSGKTALLMAPEQCEDINQDIVALSLGKRITADSPNLQLIRDWLVDNDFVVEGDFDSDITLKKNQRKKLVKVIEELNKQQALINNYRLAPYTAYYPASKADYGLALRQIGFTDGSTSLNQHRFATSIVELMDQGRATFNCGLDRAILKSMFVTMRVPAALETKDDGVKVAVYYLPQSKELHDFLLKTLESSLNVAIPFPANFKTDNVDLMELVDHLGVKNIQTGIIPKSAWVNAYPLFITVHKAYESDDLDETEKDLFTMIMQALKVESIEDVPHRIAYQLMNKGRMLFSKASQAKEAVQILKRLRLKPELKESEFGPVVKFDSDKAYKLVFKGTK